MRRSSDDKLMLEGESCFAFGVSCLVADKTPRNFGARRGPERGPRTEGGGRDETTWEYRWSLPEPIPSLMIRGVTGGGVPRPHFESSTICANCHTRLPFKPPEIFDTYITMIYFDKPVSQLSLPQLLCIKKLRAWWYLLRKS
jgi:hypothetical protein